MSQENVEVASRLRGVEYDPDPKPGDFGIIFLAVWRLPNGVSDSAADCR
jgi:hypothetical protein